MTRLHVKRLGSIASLCRCSQMISCVSLIRPRREYNTVLDWLGSMHLPIELFAYLHHAARHKSSIAAVQPKGEAGRKG